MPTIGFSRGQGRRALDQTRSGYGAALLVALAWMSEPTLAVAQSAPEFVIHLWVDPRFGDDQLAAGSGAMNPDGLNTVQMESLCALAPCPCTNPCTSSGLRPNDVVDGSGRALVHAPYPFRTLSAAVAYINAIPSRSGAPLGTPPLPYTGSNGNVWKAAIIHLLPGLYGELLPAAWVAQFGSHHPDNGLVPNGESFPIMLPRHVSVQGTNALNTFFDLRGKVGFLFGVFIDPATGARSAASSPQSVAVDGEGCSISRLTFYGGGSPNQPYQSGTPGIQYGAIVLDEEVGSRPSITNCFFLKNKVGVLVNASPSGIAGGQPTPPAVVHDGATLVNNTFAWNGVGVWSGELARVALAAPPVNGTVFGWSKLNVISNVFDASPHGVVTGGSIPNMLCRSTGQYPTEVWTSPSRLGNTSIAGWPWNVGLSVPDSAFEGLCKEDMLTMVPPEAGYEDFNAYERSVEGAPGSSQVKEKYNRSSPSSGAGYFPLTNAPLLPALPRPGTGNPTPEPVRELHDFTGFESGLILGPNGAVTGATNTARGILYVCDLLCAGSSEPPLSQGGLLGEQFAVPSVGPGGGFDLCPTDLRLSPAAAIHKENPNPQAPNSNIQLQPNAMNPLVDSGYGGGWPAKMLNGNSVEAPGTVVLNASSAARWGHDETEFDCEGYGNPRSFDHPSYPNPSGFPRPANWKFIDVGADELGELLIAGYRFGTSSYLGLPLGHAVIQSFDAANATPFANVETYYLGPVTAPSAATPNLLPAPFRPGFSKEQPRFRVLDPNAGTNHNNLLFIHFPQAYLTGPEPSLTWCSIEYALPATNYLRPWRFQGPLHPNLVPSCNPPSSAPASWHLMYQATPADTTPHLIPDVHPWWSLYLQPAFPNFFTTSNVLWLPCLSSLETNPALYDTVPGAQIAGTPNPPGSYVGRVSGSDDYQWLDGSALFGINTVLFSQFRNWKVGATGQVGTIDAFDDYCRGVVKYTGGSPPSIPNEVRHSLPNTMSPHLGTPPNDPTALRFTCEWNQSGPFSTQRNIQSFLVLIKN